MLSLFFFLLTKSGDLRYLGQHEELIGFRIDWLIDWLLTVLRPAQELFTYMETSPLPVKGCKIQAYAGRSGPLSREVSLSCHICCDTGPRFFRSHPKDRPIQSPFTTHQGMWRIYSNPDPHGVIGFRKISKACMIENLYILNFKNCQYRYYFIFFLETCIWK
jgi:hypothetical protein